MQQWIRIASFTLCLFLFTWQVRADTGVWQPHYDLGVYAFEEGDLKTAEDHLKKALEKKPDNEQALHLLGKIFLKTDRLKQAESHMDSAWQKDRNLPGLAMDQALTQFHLEEYEKAALLFLNLAPDALATYYAGISFYRQGKFAKALEQLLTASEKNSSIRANGLYHAGLCRMAMGDVNLAAADFESVIKIADTQQLRRLANEHLNRLKQDKKPSKPWGVAFKTGFSYDDNVHLAPLDRDLYSKEGDTFTEIQASGYYNILENKKYLAGAGLTSYHSWYRNLDEFNLAAFNLNLYGLKRVGDFSLGFSFAPSLYQVDGDIFLISHTAAPQVMWQAGESLLLRCTYRFSDNSYEDHPERDGRTHGMEAEALWERGEMEWTLSGGVEKNDADSQDYSYRALKSGLGLTTPLPLGFSLMADLGLEIRHHDNPDSYYGKKREETWHTLGAVLSRRAFFPWMTLEWEVRHEKNNADIDDFDYRRRMFQFSMTAEF